MERSANFDAQLAADAKDLRVSCKHGGATFLYMTGLFTCLLPVPAQGMLNLNAAAAQALQDEAAGRLYRKLLREQVR